MQLKLDVYLAVSEYIDFAHPIVAEKAAQLASGTSDDIAIAKRCFEFVRDEIRHSWDFKMNPVTCRASDVLIHRTGYCYAKSHLLAALLRANHIPAGLCYQRLTVGTDGPPYCLHGLNAVYLEQYGWYRVDARGNKPGVTASFTPPIEQLAFSISHDQERNFTNIWAEPLSPVIHALTQNSTIEQVYENLPDFNVIATHLNRNLE
jgi:transglutaminase-like putative cysteine protease